MLLVVVLVVLVVPVVVVVVVVGSGGDGDRRVGTGYCSPRTHSRSVNKESAPLSC